MRNLCLFAVTLGLFACGGADVPPPQPPPPPPPAPVAADTTPAAAATADMAAPPAAAAPSKSDKTLASLKALGDAMSAHDAAKLSALYAPDAVVKMPGMPDLTGRDAIQGHMNDMWTASPDSKGGARRIWVKDATACLEWTNTGTNTGPAMWGKPTGKAWGIDGASVYTFNDDGLVKEEHVYLDVPSMMGQLGLAPKGAPVHPIAALPTGMPEVHVAKGDATEDGNVAAAKAYNRVFEKGDLKAFLDGMTDDVTYADVSMPAPMTGKKTAEGFYTAFSKAFPGSKITEATTFGVEDFTIDEWAMDATQKAPLSMGPGMTIPNTKKSLTTHTLELIQWKGGKLAKGWAYDNSAEMFTQLGLMKPMGKPAAKGAKPAAGTKTDAKPAAPAADKAKPATK